MNYNLMPVAYAAAADPFAKSPYNPLNMSRSGDKRTTGHAPSLRILERVREAAADLALLATTQQGWKFVAEKNRAMIYEMTGRALPPAVSTTQTFGAGGGHISDYYLVRAVTTVHANIPSVLEALQARTTDEFEPKMRHVFGKHYARGVVVDELSCTTPPPFAPDPESSTGARRSFSDDDAYSVNWLSLHGPPSMGGSAKARDFTMVSYQDGFERQSGGGGVARIGRGELLERALAASSANAGGSITAPANTGLIGVHVFSSVNFKDIPALPAKSHSDRQHFRNSGFVIEATNDPYTYRLSLFLSLLPTKSSLKNARKYQKWLVSLAGIVGNIGGAVADIKPEISVAQLGNSAWKKSDHCYICLKMFRTFRRCHHCRLCGEAICSACSGFVNVSTGSTRTRSNSHSSVDMRSQYSNEDASSEGSGTFLAETRGCTVCLQNLTTQNAAVLIRKSSSSSFSTNTDPQFVTNSVISMSESHAESSVSYSGESDRPSSLANQSTNAGGHPSFQSYYDHRKRSTGGMTNNSNDDNVSVASLPLKPHASDYNSHHNTMNTPSMSTTSSSFSHDGDQHQQYYPSLHSSSSNPDLYGSQHQQPSSPQHHPRIFSSEVSEGSDLSMDPEILALAGLTMKTTSAQYAQQQAVHSVMEEEDYDDIDDSVSQFGAPAPAGAEQPPVPADASVRSDSIGWSGAESVVSTSSASAMKQPPPPRQDSTGGSTFHFSVMSNSSASAPKSSVHAEIAALMLQDLAANGPMPGSSGSISGGSGSIAGGSGSVSASQTTPGGFAPTGSAYSASRSYNPNASISSTTSHSSAGAPPSKQYASSKIISAATLAASQHRAAASQQRTSATAATATATSSARPMNDMILLSKPAPKTPEFVVFDDARRESIFTRPDDGNDMIPLDF